MQDEEVVIPRSRLELLENTERFASSLWGDEKIGMTIKERAKELNPNLNIPEVVVAQSYRQAASDLDSKLDAKAKALEDRITAFETAQNNEKEEREKTKAERSFAKEVEATKKKYQLTDEGMAKVFERMKAKNNPDVEAAAAWVTDHEPKAPTTNSSYSPQDMNLFGSGNADPDWELLNRNPFDGKFADKEISNILANPGNYKEFGGNL